MNSDNKTVSTTTPLADRVTQFKLDARNSLRMELISPRLSKITALENNKADITKQINDEKVSLAEAVWEKAHMPTDHPRAATRNEHWDAVTKDVTEFLVDLEKQMVEADKAITEQKDAILKIETGETKVSLDALNALVDEMIRKAAYNTVG